MLSRPSLREKVKSIGALCQLARSSTPKLKKNQGFTIIEVLIVLAIAALILLIVFLAVPALQRSQRNNARKQDVARIGAAIVNFQTRSSNGALPQANINDIQAILDETGCFGGYGCLQVAVPANIAKSGFLSITTAGSGTPAALSTTLTDAVQIAVGGKCNGTGATSVGASNRNAAILYTLDSGISGQSSPNCLNAQ